MQDDAAPPATEPRLVTESDTGVETAPAPAGEFAFLHSTHSPDSHHGTSNTNAPASERDGGEYVTTRLMRAIIGPIHTDYYLNRFLRFEETGRAALRWNWAAALGTLGWLMFRNLWGMALAWAGVVVALALVVFGIGNLVFQYSETTWMLLGLAFAAVLLLVPGFAGTAVFYQHCRKQMTQALVANTDIAAACAQLERQAAQRKRLISVALGYGAVAAIGTGLYGLAHDIQSALHAPVQDAAPHTEAAPAPAHATMPAEPASHTQAAAGTITTTPPPAAQAPASAASASQTSASAASPAASSAVAAASGAASAASAPAEHASSAHAQASAPATTPASAAASAPHIQATAPALAASKAPAPREAASVAATAASTPAPSASVPSQAKAKASAPAKPADKPADKSATKPRNSTASGTVSTTASKPAPATATAASPKASATKPSPEKTNAKDTTATTTERVLINVGLFAQEENAERAKAKLEAAGIKVQTQVIDTRNGKRTRVRAGPYANRKQAQAAAEKIRTLGLEAVVPPAP